jgi:hypothetical protein
VIENLPGINCYTGKQNRVYIRTTVVEAPTSNELRLVHQLTITQELPLFYSFPFKSSLQSWILQRTQSGLKMPHLLTLPRELRDMIIDFVLASPSKTPCDSPQNDEQPRTDWDEYTRIPTDRSAYRTTSFGLLTANMQLSCETSQ